MDTIRVTGHIDENGHIEVDQPIRLPAGNVMITIEQIIPEDEADERAFDTLLASPKSLAFFKQLGAQVLAEYEAGLTDELHLDTL